MIVSGNLEKQYNGIIGIDPGLTGAICVMYCSNVAKVVDMPLQAVVVNNKKRSVIDFESLLKILTEYFNKNYKFVVEMTPVFVTMSGGSSSSANWSLGYFQGFLTSFFLLKGANFRFVRTQEWHKIYGYKNIDFSSSETMKKPGQKVSERKRLIKLHSYKEAFKIAPHVELIKVGKKFSTGRITNDKVFDGRSEAILIANYGRS